MNSPDYLSLPDPNDADQVERHKNAVLTRFSAMFELVDAALEDSIPKALDIFSLLGGPADRAVHAMNTRYQLKVFLTANQVPTEEAGARDDLSVQWVPNCGLHITLPEAEFRILKSAFGGIPKPTSDARLRYYSSNQMLLGFVDDRNEPAVVLVPLVLVLLWDVDEEFNYLGFEIACPRTVNRDGTVDCYWITKWDRRGSGVQEAPAPQGPDRDLDEIKKIEPGASRAAGKA